MDPGWITALVALITAIGGIGAFVLRRGWRATRRWTHFLDDYFGEPARDGLPAKPGVMARLGSVEEMLARVAAETTANGGHSMRDLVHRTGLDVAEIKKEQVKMRARMELFEKQRAGRED